MSPFVAALIASATLAIGWLLGRWLLLRTTRPSEPVVARSGNSMAGASYQQTPGIEQALVSLPLGVIIVDAAGRDVFRNEFAQAFKTARHDDAIVEAAITELIETATNAEADQAEVELWGPPVRSLRLFGTPTFDDGTCIGATITIEDTSKENEVLRARKDLVGNVSHELRTPAGAMVSLSEALEKVDDGEVRQRLIGRVKEQALRLSEIVDDLLVLSEVESSDASGFEPVDLGLVLADTLKLASDGAEDKGVSIIGLNHAGRPVLVDGDRRQLMSVVSNLCDNAIKYSPTGSRVVLSIDADDVSAFVTVKDTGVGVPESAIDRIFERFYRVDSARSRDTGGSGLGLSIVRNALKNHGGTISVRSVEGRGSTFTAKLPLALPETPQPDLDSSSGSQQPKEAS